MAQVSQPYVYQADVEDNLSDVAFALLDAPAGMTVDQEGTVRWTPGPDQLGPRTFRLQATDAAGNSSSQVISLTVLSAIPALPDSYTTPEDQVLIVDAQSGLLANDGNDDTGILTVTLLVQPAHGTLQLNGDGSFRCRGLAAAARSLLGCGSVRARTAVRPA